MRLLAADVHILMLSVDSPRGDVSADEVFVDKLAFSSGHPGPGKGEPARRRCRPLLSGEPMSGLGVIGTSIPRVDGVEKVTGTRLYTADGVTVSPKGASDVKS